ncbi:hypothetical protein RchiOBHm_Chr1g0320341 [Rosa chinensis]|uniref:Uncharacterized protein n=1 Tax=Rosa chinensis TaxID=74649 RepID=A0A2P6S8M9_ROSCH|nr:hypothetical protein RchiOBHm_Chr1g0320341 [Rosa chinensis]
MTSCLRSRLPPAVQLQALSLIGSSSSLRSGFFYHSKRPNFSLFLNRCASILSRSPSLQTTKLFSLSQPLLIHDSQSHSHIDISILSLRLTVTSIF